MTPLKKAILMTERPLKISMIQATLYSYYDSGEYKETIFLRTDFIKENIEAFNELEVWVYGFDGKHSQAKADIEIKDLTEEELLKFNFSELSSFSGGELMTTIDESLNENDVLDLNDEIEVVEHYINSLDTISNVTVKVRKSQMELFRNFCDQNNINHNIDD